MEIETVIIFVGMIVSACIVGGAIYAGLDKIASAISDKEQG